MKVIFKNVVYEDNGKLSADILRDDHEPSSILIKLPKGTVVDDELIALSFSTFCGTKYDDIEMELSISKDCKELIENFCNATLQCQLREPILREIGSNSALSFSGGFDSLAAKAILEDDASLISLDFGGSFSRERAFFEKFNTNIIETNLVDLKLNRNHWSFMAMGAILLRESLSIKSITFGSIMASSIPRILEIGTELSEDILPHLSYLNIDLFNPLAGVTEIGALSITLKSNSADIKKSLTSLANPKEGKFFRKSLALNTYCHDKGFKNIVVDIPKPRAWYKWGKSYADDLSALYVLKKAGRTTVEQSYVNGIPEKVFQQIDTLSLDFFERYNPEVYMGLGIEKVNFLFSRFSHFGLLPFTRKDYEELSIVDALINIELD